MGRRNYACSLCGMMNDHYATKCPKAKPLARGRVGAGGARKKAARKSSGKRRRTDDTPRRVKQRTSEDEPPVVPLVASVIAPPVVVADLGGDARASVAQVRHLCETRKSPDEVKAMKLHADGHGRDDFADMLYDLCLYDNDGYDMQDDFADNTPCLAILLARLARTRAETNTTTTLNFPEAISPGYMLKKDYHQDTTFSMRDDASGPGGPCVVRWLGALRRCVPRVHLFQRMTRTIVRRSSVR